MPCAIMSLDAMDVSGEAHLDVIHNIYKVRRVISASRCCRGASTARRYFPDVPSFRLRTPAFLTRLLTPTPASNGSIRMGSCTTPRR